MSTHDTDNAPDDINTSDLEENEGSDRQEVAPDAFIKTQDQAVEFSSKLMKALNGKTKDHNALSSNNKVTPEQLNEVYCEAVRSYNSEIHPMNKNHFGFARINMFLDMTMGKFPQPLQESGVDLLSSDIDMTLGFTPDSECWASAKEDIQKFDIDYDFDSIDDLYVEEPEELEFYWD